MKNNMMYTMSFDIDMSTVSCSWNIHTASVDFIAHTSDKGVIKNGQTVTNYEVFTNKKKYYSNATMNSYINWIASDGVRATWAFYLYPSAFDGEAPTIDNLTSVDLKTNAARNYATLRRYDFAGIENYGQTVNYTITDDTGKVFNSGLLQVNQDGDKSYTTSIQPAIEVAPGETKLYTLKVVDQYKWETIKKFEVKNLDSRPPESKTDNTAKTWSKTKTYTATATDYGVGEVSIALNKDIASNYVLANKNGNKYTQTYNFNGNATGGAVASVYYKDGLDNKATYYLTVWNIDNTNPTFTITTKDNGLSTKKATVTLKADDYCSTIKEQGSGKVADGAGKYGFYYGYSKTNNVNTATWTSLQTADTYTYNFEDAGEYYFWVKDYAGNISNNGAGTKVFIDKFTLNLAKDSIANVNESSYTHYIFSPNQVIEYPASEIATKRTNFAFNLTLENNGNSKMTYEGIDLTGIDTSTSLKGQIEGKSRSSVSFGRTFLGWFTENTRTSVNIGSSGTYVNITPNRTTTNLYNIKGNTTNTNITTNTKSKTLYPLWQNGLFVLPNCIRDKDQDIFYGWYTKPQIGNGENVTDVEFVGKAGDVVLISGSKTLYPWFNRKPVLVDVYEGLFFEGQDISLQDLKKLVGVFDYEDDYSNIAVEFIESLPTVDKDALYLPIIVQKDESLELEKDYSESEILETIQIENYEFDSSRWEKVSTQEYWTNLAESGDWEQVGENATVQEEYAYGEFSNKNPIYIQDGLLYTPENPEGIDGVYRLKDTGDVYYTAEAKAALAYYINNPEYTSLELKVKSVTYHVVDGALGEETQNLDVSLTDYEKYVNEKEISIYTNEQAKDRNDVGLTYRLSTNKIDTGTNRLVITTEDGKVKGEGYFDVTYEVSDKGLILNGALIADSPITLTYTRECKLQYNQLPIIALANVMEFTSTKYDNYKDLKDAILNSQVVIDGEDLVTNLPWWTRKKTATRLGNTLEIIKIKDVLVDKVLCEKYNLDSTALQNEMNSITDFETFYNTYYNTNAWKCLASYYLVVDAHDQWGKYASGRVLKNYKVANVEETAEDSDRPKQLEPFRTIGVVMINDEDDVLLNSGNIMEKVRFINRAFGESSISEDNSYWGTTEGNQKLNEVFDKKDNSTSGDSQSTEYQNGVDSNTVNITINDYSN